METFDVVVVGGGLAGLVAAATVADGGRRAALVDAHPLGGRARSVDRDGHTFNVGPHALYLDGPGRAILIGLGIDPPGAAPVIKGSMGLRDGRLGLLPGGPVSLLRTDLLRATSKVQLARVLAQVGRWRPVDHAHETVDEWLATTGLPDDAAALVHLLVRVATYVDAPDRLSADIAITQLQYALGGGVRYLDGGWQALTDRLADRARQAGAELRTGVRVRAVDADDGGGGGGGVVVHTDAGDLGAGAVVVAAGTPASAAAVLGHRPAGWDGLGPEVEAASLDLGLGRVPPHRVVFGVDEPLYWSVHGPAARLAPEGGAVAHAMRYLPPGVDPGPADDDRRRLEALARQAGVADDDVVVSRFQRRLVVMGGFPIAAAGGLAGRPDVAVSDAPGVFVAGDWVGGQGLLADAALTSGVRAAREAADRAAMLSVP